ncbi:MAG: HAMP domain-containing sensor histidine kinase [Pseudomonadota bacterium]
MLKTKVMGALDEISAASVLITSGSAEIGRSKTIEVLEQTIDVEVNNLIEAEISRERESLQRAESEMQRFNELTQTVAIVSVILALLISVFIVLILSRRLTMGLRALETGARAYAADDLDHVIDLPGEDELSAVAGRFNDMAQQILTKHRALEEIRDELEDMVDSRTEELSTAVSELQERDTSRRRFFADIGHELRTPVTAIRGEAEVALRSRSDNEANYQNALVQIVSLSEQLTDFVTDLFLVAREQAGVLDFRDRELDLNIPVKRGIEAIGSIAAEKGARVDQRFADVPLPIMGNEKHIAQLVQILVTNALLHARAGVNIALSTRRDGDHVLLAIEDDGPGIAPKDRSRIFDRFAKGQPSRDATGSSTGLGLAIAKSITQAHGGSISVGDSEMGGARFVASFPVPELEDAA